MDTNDNAHRSSDTSTETATLSRPYRSDGSRHLEVPVPAVSAKRISWGAISAGVVMALVTQLAFSLLGLGLGPVPSTLTTTIPQGTGASARPSIRC
jgi:hypothetical protein